MKQSPPWSANFFSAGQETVSFYGTRRFITVFTTACQWRPCSGRRIQFTSTIHCLKIRIIIIIIIIILPYTPRSSKRYISCSSCHQNSVRFLFFPLPPSFSLIHPTDSLRAGRSGDRIPMGARFSAPVHTGTTDHPASYTMGSGSFLGVKRPRRDVNHPHPSSAKVEERVELYLFSPSRPSWSVLGLILPLTLPLRFGEQYKS